MTRNDYLNDLAAKLSRLPQTERDDAMAFYTEYFEDAESDDAAIESLGSPARLAAQINAEYSARMLEERGQASKQAEPQAAPASGPKNDIAGLPSPPQGYTRADYKKNSGPQPNAEGFGGTAQSRPSQQYTGRGESSISWIWAVVLGIFALPVALPIAIVAFVVVVVVVALCIALVAVLLSVVGWLVYIGIGSLLGIGSFAVGTGGGLIVIGGAVISLGLAFILIPLLIMLCIWLVGAIGRLVTRIFNSLKRRSQKNEEA
jgi:Predicted membrane protein